MSRVTRLLALRTAAVAAVIAAWWAAAVMVGSQILLPSPWQVAAALWEEREVLQAAFGSSLQLYVIGLALAIVVGIAVGSLLGASRTLGAMFDPVVNALYVTPRIILVPLVIGWFGIFVTGKIVLVFAVCVFEVLLFTRDGIRTLGQDYLEVARVFRAGAWRRLRDIYLPGAAPSILTGVRLAAGRGTIGVVVAEFFMAIFAPTDGVAAFVRLSAEQFRTAAALAGVAVLIAFGVVAQGIVAVLERRVAISRGG